MAFLGSFTIKPEDYFVGSELLAIGGVKKLKNTFANRILPLYLHTQ
ncbi:hypothetical protein FM107_11755 [Sphingobacterium sp. JB170]|nr:hypothetical protein FM107_11755 [Sphingobacterium sp. JB170]